MHTHDIGGKRSTSNLVLAELTASECSRSTELEATLKGGLKRNDLSKLSTADIRKIHAELRRLLVQTISIDSFYASFASLSSNLFTRLKLKGHSLMTRCPDARSVAQERQFRSSGHLLCGDNPTTLVVSSPFVQHLCRWDVPFLADLCRSCSIPQT